MFFLKDKLSVVILIKKRGIIYKKANISLAMLTKQTYFLNNI